MATKNIINDIKSNPSQILPDLWGNLNQAIPNLTNPVTSPLIPANAAAGMIGSTVGSIGDTLKSTLQTGEGMMGLGNNPNVPQAMSPKEKAQYAANSPMTNLVNAAGGAANLGGIALGLGLLKAEAPATTDTMPDMPSKSPSIEALHEQNVNAPAGAIKEFEQTTRIPYPQDQASMQNVLNESNKAQAAGDWERVKTINQAIMALPDSSPMSIWRKGAYSMNARLVDPQAFQEDASTDIPPVKPPVEENGIFGSQKGGIDFNAKIGGGDEPATPATPATPAPNNTWSPYISDENGSPVLDANGKMQPNPNYDPSLSNTSIPGREAYQNTVPLDKNYKAQGGNYEPVESNPVPQRGITPPSQEAYGMNTANPNLPPVEGTGATTGAVEPDGALPPRADVPKQPDLTPAQEKALAKNGLDKYQLPEKYKEYRDQLETQDKSVMANLLGADEEGSTPQDILRRVNNPEVGEDGNIIPGAKDDVWGQVEAKAKSIPSVTIKENVIPYLKSRLDGLVNQGIITPEQESATLTQESIKINSRSGNAMGANPSITGSDLVDLQTGANKVAPKTIPQNTTSVAPYINKAIASGYGDALGNINPEIRYLYDQYSSLKRIGEMPNSFRNAPPPPPEEALTSKIANAVTPKGVKTVAKQVLPPVLLNPTAGKIAAGAVAAGGLLGAGYELAQQGKNPSSSIGNTSQNEANSQKGHVQGQYNTKITHVSDIPQSQDKINPDDGVTNPYGLRDANNNPIAFSPGQGAAVMQSAENLKIQGGYGYPASYYTNSTIGQQQVAAMEAKIKAKTDLGTQLDPTQTKQLWSKAQEAKQFLSQAPLNLLNTYDNFDKLSRAFNGKYAKLANDLQMLESYSGKGTLLSPQTNDVALSVLDGAERNFLNDYNQKLITATGGGAATQNLSQLKNENLPSNAPATPNNTLPDMPNMWGSTTSTPQDTLHNVSMPNLP